MGVALEKRGKDDAMTDISAIKETVTPIAQRHGVKRVYLFASRARGDNCPDSDYDLLMTKATTGKLRTPTVIFRRIKRYYACNYNMKGDGFVKKCLIAFTLLLFLCCVPALASDEWFIISGGTLLRYDGPPSDNIKIPSGVTVIANSVFSGRSDFTSVTLPDGVTTIQGDAFSGCSALKSINLPDSLTSIESYAFYGCNSLSNITVGGNLKSIGNGAFQDCSSLSVFALPDSVTTIGEYAFYNSGLTSFTLPASVTHLGSCLFHGCSKLTSFTFADGRKHVPWILDSKSPITNIILGDSIEEIEESAFMGLDYLTSVKFGKGLKTIGTNSFRDCSSLKSIALPNGVTTIKDCAFANSGLIDVEIPDSVTAIGYGAFMGCPNLTSVTFGDGLKSIGDIFSDNPSLTNITLGNGITEIDSCGFRYLEKLATVKLGNNLKVIGSEAFHGCSSLNSIEIPNSVTTIKDSAFAETGLRDITIPDSVTAVGYGVFWGCSKLISATIKSDIKDFGRLFDENSPLTKVTLGDKVTEIGSCGFRYLEKLATVKLGNNLKVIGSEAFHGCSSLTSIALPNSITTIVYGAFWDSGLKNVAIPGSVTSIGSYALNTESLKHIYYAGDEKSWQLIGGENAVGENVTVHYNRSLPLSGVIREPDATIAPEQYCLRIVDANGNPLSGAAVTWGAESGTTGNDGQAFFSVPENQSPVITVTKDGYFPWNNKGGAWTLNSNRYSVIVLHETGGISDEGGSWGGNTPGDSGKTPSDTGNYRLSVANYYGSAVKKALGKPIDLLTKVKTLNLKNDGNLVGDLSLGNFYIRCATTGENAERFELWQGGKKIAQSPDGNFDLNVKSFSKGGRCFVRVIAKSGEYKDTKINLQFEENEINPDTTFSLKGKKFTFSVADSVPFLGGRTLTFELPIRCPVYHAVDNDKIIIGLNIQQFGGSMDEIRKQRSKYEHTFRRSIAFGDMQWNRKRNEKASALLKRYISSTNKSEFLSPCEFSVSGYFEADIGSNVATGYLILTLDATLVDFQYTSPPLPPPIFIPATVNIGLDLSADIGEELAVTINPWGFTGGNFLVNPTAHLEAFGGLGVGKLFSGGAYGSADVKIEWNLFGTEAGLQKVDLTGELGLKAYIATHEKSLTFAHNTWHIYTPSALQSADTESTLYASLCDATQYRLSDLGYLSAESAWMGDTASLLEASARTELVSLLSDTYRNAQPVMTATDNALYAAFVRADADSGARYVVVTKFDGTSWSEPVRADANAVLDSVPALCADGNTLYLAYARTTENPGDSLLSYALKQEIIVGSVNPDTLSFTEQSTFSGLNPDSSFVSMPQLSAANGRMILAWADSAVSDDNSVLRPTSGVIRYVVCSDGVWGDASDRGTVNAPVDSITIGERNAALVIACLLDEDSERNLYLLTASGQERIAENISGTVAYARLPGTDKASFLWNGENVLTSSAGNSAEVPGISGEYAISGNNVYYSAATDGSANLTVLQYHADSGTWGLPIQLTDGNRYLENLSVASLNGTDYALGMHTAATITENAVEDAKNLVWSAVRPVSDLCLDGIDYDVENVKAGESLPVTLTVINAGDHTVNRIAVTLNNSAVKTQDCSLKPGESLDIEVSVSSPSSLSEYLFAVEEPDKDDYSPDDNAATVQIGYADAAIELEYQQIGAKKALMATVTNRGVETANGSVAFYDANGSAVAESAFANLASGDTTIAVYELDGNFAGINGGDVSAKVTLEEEELYTYNNADTLHIMEAESNPEKTEIASAVANGERGINAEISCESELTATAYCAFYNSDGKMLSVEIRSLSTGQNSLTFTASDQAASKAKIFVLDDQMIPQCANATVEVT